jgi:hypothetical protein
MTGEFEFYTYNVFKQNLPSPKENHYYSNDSELYDSVMMPFCIIQEVSRGSVVQLWQIKCSVSCDELQISVTLKN